MSSGASSILEKEAEPGKSVWGRVAEVGVGDPSVDDQPMLAIALGKGEEARGDI